MRGDVKNPLTFCTLALIEKKSFSKFQVMFTGTGWGKEMWLLVNGEQ